MLLLKPGCNYDCVRLGKGSCKKNLLVVILLREAGVWVKAGPIEARKKPEKRMTTKAR